MHNVEYSYVVKFPFFFFSKQMSVAWTLIFMIQCEFHLTGNQR